MQEEELTLYEQLDKYVKDNGIKQAYIAQQTGLSADTISKVLRGERRMMADEFLNICFALGIDPAQFKRTA